MTQFLFAHGIIIFHFVAGFTRVGFACACIIFRRGGGDGKSLSLVPLGKTENLIGRTVFTALQRIFQHAQRSYPAGDIFL